MESQQSQKTLNSLLASKKVNSERLECMEQFIAARQTMMNTPAVAFQYDDSGKCGIADQLMRDLVIRPHTFAFEIKGLDCVLPRDKEISLVIKMQYLDQAMRKEIFESNKISFSTFFVYEVQGGVDGIAISKNGSCFAHVDIVLYQTTGVLPRQTSDPMINMNELKSQRSVLFKILIKSQFAKDENSAKLESMEWIVLEDLCVPK